MEHETILIDAIVAGKDGYEQLVERYHIGLIIHCEQMVHDRDVAEDIAQQAFIKAYMQLATYNPAKARFSTWLYRIATNVAIDYLRQRKHIVDVEDIETVAETTMPMHIEDEEREHIRACVAALQPPEYRQVIEAYYWHGKSYQDIAQELGTPLNTIRTWMRRAKQELKAQLS